MTLQELFRQFPNDEAAEEWFTGIRWPDGVKCPKCGSDNIQERATRKPQPYRCRSCRKDFSVRTGTLMHGTNLGLQTWVVAIYLLNTGIKGVSSMKLHRELGVTQKTAWHLAHRIRETWEDNGGSLFSGPVEADETYVGGKRRNMSNAKRKEATGRGAVGKTAVAGIKDRPTRQVAAKVVKKTDAATLQGFVKEHTEAQAQVYTDDASAYIGLDRPHESVKHSVSEFVNGMAHTNGMESFWSMFKRGHKGTYHKMSPKHLQRYVNEFAGRHNIREKDTIDQMQAIAAGFEGKWLRYKDLKADNGLEAGARG